MFDYGGTIIQFLIARITNRSGVISYTRFIQLIFIYLCPNVVFDNDALVPIFQIFDKAIKDHESMDDKNGLHARGSFLLRSGIFCKRNCLLSMGHQLLIRLLD